MKKLITILGLAFSLSGAFAQNITKFIAIDQFGYRPQDKKIAVLRNPQVGYDQQQSYTPGNTIEVINATTKASVYSGSITYKNNGTSNDAYGDEVWWFDFSAVTDNGEYYILDRSNNVRSYRFSINPSVYNNVLKHAMRMFFYQRVGCDKLATYAGAAWADKASHLGKLQDANCRLYSDKTNSSTERDLQGGWFDAGDFNKYTSWTANYIESLLTSYLENPDVWQDNYNIPESGNGIADVLDEARWGLDWLVRMQENDGGVLCVMGLEAASPPSKATGQSVYGPATTNASYSAARAYAIGSLVFKDIDATYAAKLKTCATKAWAWAEANPSVEFRNSDNGVAAGEQEAGSSDNSRLYLKMSASLYMYELTGESAYLQVFESNYTNYTVFKWYSSTDQYRSQETNAMLHYLSMDGVNESIKSSIKKTLKTAFTRDRDFAGKLGTDAYLSYCNDYNWGSNGHKSYYGVMFYSFGDFCNAEEEYTQAALDYLHYIHGVNPFSMVYLTNMNNLGASNSVNQMYHSWFCHGSSLWDDATTTYGPAPGYLIGGPYDEYALDGCCPDNCGSKTNNALCNASYTFSSSEPVAKRYHDFNNGWPVNSWSITEPSCGYQVNYIRLLSKFASAIEDEENNPNAITNYSNKVHITPNPTSTHITISTENTDDKVVDMYDTQTHHVYHNVCTDSQVVIDIQNLPAGVYFLQVFTQGNIYTQQVVVTK